MKPSKYISFVKSKPDKSGIEITPSKYLLQLTKNVAIAELEQYLSILKTFLKNAASNNLKAHDKSNKIKDIEFESLFTEGFLSRLKEGYELNILKGMDIVVSV